jgi:hypothetical protein
MESITNGEKKTMNTWQKQEMMIEKRFANFYIGKAVMIESTGEVGIITDAKMMSVFMIEVKSLEGLYMGIFKLSEARLVAEVAQ